MTRTKTDKMRNLLHQGEATPEQQQKIKVAFAEGYMANDKKEGEPTKNTFLSRTLRVFVYLCAFWLAIQVLQIFSAMGGSKLVLLILICILIEMNWIYGSMLSQVGYASLHVDAMQNGLTACSHCFFQD